MHPEILSDAIEPLIGDGLIDDVLFQVKSGKEGTLYCCSGGWRLAVEHVAVKVYKSRRFRSFRDDSMYRAGRVILNRRSARAAAKRTSFGQEVLAAEWNNSEYQTLRVLHRAGALVPKPLGHSSGALVMEWIGDGEGPAPQLREVELGREDAEALFEQVVAEVELWLACNIVHGDLSAYNLLYNAGRVVAIDFPQACDPRFNANAPELLSRDLSNVSRYFGRYGVRSDPQALSDDLWERYTRGAL